MGIPAAPIGSNVITMGWPLEFPWESHWAPRGKPSWAPWGSQAPLGFPLEPALGPNGGSEILDSQLGPPFANCNIRGRFGFFEGKRTLSRVIRFDASGRARSIQAYGPQCVFWYLLPKMATMQLIVKAPLGPQKVPMGTPCAFTLGPHWDSHWSPKGVQPGIPIETPTGVRLGPREDCHWLRLCSPLGPHWDSYANPAGFPSETLWEPHVDPLGFPLGPLVFPFQFPWGFYVKPMGSTLGFLWAPTKIPLGSPLPARRIDVGAPLRFPMKFPPGSDWNPLVGSHWNPLVVQIGTPWGFLCDSHRAPVGIPLGRPLEFPLRFPWGPYLNPLGVSIGIPLEIPMGNPLGSPKVSRWTPIGIPSGARWGPHWNSPIPKSPNPGIPGNFFFGVRVLFGDYSQQYYSP